jgi:hypothetical protein
VKKDLTGLPISSFTDWFDSETIQMGIEILWGIASGAIGSIIASLLFSNQEKSQKRSVELLGIRKNQKLSLKLRGKWSEKQCNKIIENFFDLAKQYDSGNAELMYQSKTYDLCDHMFVIDPNTQTLHEINIAQVIEDEQRQKNENISENESNSCR